MPERKQQKHERSHLENQERAYIAASRRNDRSLEARIQSARQASIIHKERTGKALRITEEVVKNEEMYEEVEEELPRRFRMLAPHMQTKDEHLNSRLDAYLSNKVAMSQLVSESHHDWERQEEVHRLFAEAFPSLRSKSYGGNAQSAGPDLNSFFDTSNNPHSLSGSVASSASVSPELSRPQAHVPAQSFPSPVAQPATGLPQQPAYQGVKYGVPGSQPRRGQSFAAMPSPESFQTNLVGMNPRSFSGVLPTTYSSGQLGMATSPPELTPDLHSTISHSQTTPYFGGMPAPTMMAEHSVFTPELPPEARMLLEDSLAQAPTSGWHEINKPLHGTQSGETYYQGGNTDPTMGWEIIPHPASVEEPNWDSFINDGDFGEGM